MDYLEPHHFLREIIEVCMSFEIVSSYESHIDEDIILKMRIFLTTTGVVIDIFYNSQNGKTSFALIRNRCRIYGADNALPIGWHIHPFDNPDTHVPSEPVSFKWFLEIVKKYQRGQTTV